MNVILIIAFTVIALLNTYRIEASMMKLEPSSLTFDDYKESTKTVSVSLDYAPLGNVHAAIAIVGNYFSISPCNLSFTPANWNVGQIVTIRALPIVLNTASQTYSADIKFEINSAPNEGDVFDNPDGSLCKRSAELFRPFITRTVRQSKFCQSNGDPHYVSFDNEGYTVSGKTDGYHYLVKTAETTIIDQQFQAYTGAILTNKKVGIRHYDSYVTIALNDAVISTSTATSPISHDKISVIAGSTPGLITVTTNTVGKSYTVNLADGSTISVGTQFWSGTPNKWFLNIGIRVPATYFNRTSGYCGNFDGVAVSNMAILMATANAPVVSAADNYFSCPGATLAQPMKGCTSTPKSFSDTCTPSKASVNLCDEPVFTSSVANKVVTSSVVVVKSSTVANAAAAASNTVVSASPVNAKPTSTAAGNFASASTTTIIVAASSTPTAAVNNNNPTTSTSAPVQSVEPLAPAPAPATNNMFDSTPFTQCFSTQAAPVIVAQLLADESDVEVYCTNVFQDMKCLGSSSAYLSSCTDASLAEVQNHAQSVMNAARDDCSRHVKSLAEAQIKADRDYAIVLAAQYNIQIRNVSCDAAPVVVDQTGNATPIASNPSSPASPTSVSNEDNDAVDGGSSNNTGAIAIGVGSASAVLAVGAAIGGMIVFLRHRRQSNARAASGTALAFENPLYGSAKMHENLIYSSSEATDNTEFDVSSTKTEHTKRRQSLNSEVINRI